MAKLLVNLDAWFLPPHFSKLHHSNLVKYCLHLYQHCLVDANLDEVTGTKNSFIELLKAVNAYVNSKVSLKMD